MTTPERPDPKIISIKSVEGGVERITFILPLVAGDTVEEAKISLETCATDIRVSRADILTNALNLIIRNAIEAREQLIENRPSKWWERRPE